MPRFRALIQDPAGERVLVDAERRLPVLPIEEPWLTFTHLMNAAIESEIGLRAIALRYFELDYELRKTELPYSTFAFEALEPGPTGDMRWVRPDEVDAQDRDRLNVWMERGPAPNRAAWASPGWFTRASTWFESTLRDRGLELLAPTEQFRAWAISSLLRVTCADGVYYMKAVPPMFGAEATVTGSLSRSFPEHLPAVLGSHPEGWFVMADIGGTAVEDLGAEVWERALVEYARLQSAARAHKDDLVAAHVPDRGFHLLPGQIAEVLADPAAVALFDAGHIERLTALQPAIDRLVRDAAGSRMGNTLVHGDLHAGNVALVDGEFVYYDWSDVCLGHPMVDLATFFFSFGPAQEDAEVRDHWMRSYVAQWTDVGSVEDLLAEWDLVRPLAFLHHTMNYVHIWRFGEPPENELFLSFMGMWLRRAVEELEGL